MLFDLKRVAGLPSIYYIRYLILLEWIESVEGTLFRFNLFRSLLCILHLTFSNSQLYYYNLNTRTNPYILYIAFRKEKIKNKRKKREEEDVQIKERYQRNTYHRGRPLHLLEIFSFKNSSKRVNGVITQLSNS